MPGTKVMPVSRAVAAASSQPAAVSWSVSATTSSPAATASRTSSRGELVPSERLEWVWRSIRTRRRVVSRISGRSPVRAVLGERQRHQVRSQRRGVDERPEVVEKEYGGRRPQDQPQPPPSGLAGEVEPVEGRLPVADRHRPDRHRPRLQTHPGQRRGPPPPPPPGPGRGAPPP